ncbi:MAG TPA: DegT/DnrJ/EryC1/StrS aminotransferase family protein [Candidatus Dormibacteraeota bacterium]|nr:DegT/DnrJ/EryC1/StrS aminotransferase family protein [Candidatus Dormibacteraeota bacterium]
MRTEFLHFSPPLIGDEEIEEVVKTLREGWITTGPRTQRFEANFAQRVGAPAALAVNSATSAMHIALAVLGVGEGDEVITTPMTFVSTVHVIEHQRATPVLVDVETDTLNIDPARIEATITPRTKAIMPVHLYGHPADMAPIYDIAQRHRLAVIEDAAHALPAQYHGRTIGAPQPGFDFPNLVAFSFYATKNLTTGEGGMLTGAPDLLEDARVWSLHGMSRDAFKRYTSDGSWRYDVVRPGFKYNMPDIQAAIGLHQLERLEAMQRRRRAIVSQYDEALGQLPEIDPPVERPGVESAWHIYLLRLELDRLRIDRAGFIDELRKRNIGTSVHFIPVPDHTYYRERYGWRPQDFPVAYREFDRMLSLPLSPALTDQDVADVIEAVTEVVRANRA